MAGTVEGYHHHPIHHHKPSNRNLTTLPAIGNHQQRKGQPRPGPEGRGDCPGRIGNRPRRHKPAAPQVSSNGFGTPQITLREAAPPNSETTQENSAFGVLYQLSSDGSTSVKCSVSNGIGKTSAYQPRFFIYS